MTNLHDLSRKDAAPIVKSLLEELAADEDDSAIFKAKIDNTSGHKTTDERKLIEFIRTRIVKPCRYYADQLANNTFLPAAYDAVMNPSYTESYYIDALRENQFALGTIYYEVCRKIVEADAWILMKNIARLIESDSN